MRNHFFVTFLKLVVAPVGLIWLVASLFKDPLPTGEKLNWALLAAALAANQMALTMFAVRMRVILRAFSIEVTFSQAQRIHLQSMFYFFVLPMTVGLEAARFGKIKYLLQGKANGMGLASSLVADRLVGALTAVALALAVWPMMDFNISFHWQEYGLLPWAVIGVAVILGLLIYRKFRGSLQKIRLESKPEIGALMLSLLVATITHLLFSLGVYLAATGANVQIDFPQTLFVISASMIFVVLPLSFAGAGPVEGAGLSLLVGMGMPLDKAALFVLIAYIAKLIAALEGGLWEIGEGMQEYLRRK